MKRLSFEFAEYAQTAEGMIVVGATSGIIMFAIIIKVNLAMKIVKQ